MIPVEPSESVYVSEVPLYALTEIEPLVASERPSEEPLPKGSPEWCEWYLESVGGVVVPTFDEGYYIYTQNCR